MTYPTAYAILENSLIRHEGLKLKPYKCPAGKLTIGVGRNLEDNGISEQEAMYLLSKDIHRCGKELASHLPNVRGALLGEDIRTVVVLNMIFNLGISRFKKFKNMIAAVENRQWKAASLEMLDSRWARQVGPRAKELSKMMLTGEYDEV